MILKLYVLHLTQESQWQSGVGLPSGVLGVSSVPGMSLVMLNFRVCYDAPCNDAPEVALSYVDCSVLCCLQQVGVRKPHEEPLMPLNCGVSSLYNMFE